jgi:hypothetical protein
MATPGCAQAGVQHAVLHGVLRSYGAATHLAPPRNALEIPRFWSDIRPVLKESGADDDKCVARWDEVG